MPYKNALEKFKKGINKGNFKNHIANGDILDPKDNAIFEDAVYAAYLDAARTFTNIETCSTAKQARKALAKKLQDYFSDKPCSAEENFDINHNDWCEGLISDFGRSDYAIKYGQAQKIVNMAFKYLYCLKDACLYKDHFEYCHIALDSFTLEWIWRQTKPTSFNKYEAWSKLNYRKSPTSKKPGYLEIVDLWRNLWKSPSVAPFACTPFQAEFIFWEEIQTELAAEELLACLNRIFAAPALTISSSGLKSTLADIKKLI